MRRGGEVRIYARSAGGREEAKSFVENNLADIARQLGGTPGHVVLCDSMEAAVANVGLAIEAVPEQLELKREVFRTTSNPTLSISRNGASAERKTD